MHTGENYIDREKNYEMMVALVKDLVATEKDEIAVLSNISAMINHYMDDINWVGFYIWKEDELVLGPFQGKPACLRIKKGKGVCGLAVVQKKCLIVGDVHKFPNHIACDSASNSEIVLPMYKQGTIFGVLDVDSPTFHRFGALEHRYLQQIVYCVFPID